MDGFPSNNRFLLIGEGISGKVYHGENIDNGEIFVVKVVDYSNNSGFGIPSELLREISSLQELSELQHPNIVKLIEIIP